MKYRITLIDRKTLEPAQVDGWPVVVTTTDAEHTEDQLMRNRSPEQYYCTRERIG
jgi:hypothetical protein